MLTEENIRYELELSEIKSKYKGEIQVIYNAIYFVTLNDDYYKGTEAQYSAEVSNLTKEIASIKSKLLYYQEIIVKGQD